MTFPQKHQSLEKFELLWEGGGRGLGGKWSCQLHILRWKNWIASTILDHFWYTYYATTVRHQSYILVLISYSLATLYQSTKLLIAGFICLPPWKTLDFNFILERKPCNSKFISEKMKNVAGYRIRLKLFNTSLLCSVSSGISLGVSSNTPGKPFEKGWKTSWKTLAF